MDAAANDPRTYKTFAEFYPFYLSEHSNRTCRRLHFVGSTLALACLAMLVATGKPQYLLYGLLCGYGFAWVGHFGFQKNKPATFQHPIWSFRADLRMWSMIAAGTMDAEVERFLREDEVVARAEEAARAGTADPVVN